MYIYIFNMFKMWHLILIFVENLLHDGIMEAFPATTPPCHGWVQYIIQVTFLILMSCWKDQVSENLRPLAQGENMKQWMCSRQCGYMPPWSQTWVKPSISKTIKIISFLGKFFICHIIRFCHQWQPHWNHCAFTLKYILLWTSCAY